MNFGRLLARALAWLAFTGTMVGCALTSKSDSVVLRYFSPVSTLARTTTTDAEAPRAAPELALRLGRVTAARHLKEKIAFRDSAYELGFYDDLRWTEKPEAYLRRALRTSLFEEHRVVQRVSGVGLTLDIDLDAFEELKTPHQAGRVGVTWTLRDDQVVLAEEAFVIERAFAPKGEGEPTALIAALSGALDEAVTRIVTRSLAAARR